jgi:hypothetical protein
VYLGNWTSFNGESSLRTVGDTCRCMTGRYVRGDASPDFGLLMKRRRFRRRVPRVVMRLVDAFEASFRL